MARMPGRVLVVDDDPAICIVVGEALRRQGHKVKTAASIRERGAMMASFVPEVLVTDVMLPDGDGLEGIDALCEADPALSVIIFSAQNTLNTAVRATEKGAFEYLPKPFDLNELTRAVSDALAIRRQEAEGGEVAVDGVVSDGMPLIGRSPAMQEVYRTIARVISNDLTILVLGESGTGKELVAEAIHGLGRRRTKPFVPINMAAIPRELIEAELFGYEKGAFTGAHSRTAGKFEQAQGGTLFLDEIGDMPLPLQTRLLRVLAEREVLPLGADEPVRVDLNVVAASHRDLRRQIVAGTFREDLYYRLCGATLALPALRERGDKAFLIERILEMEAQAMGVRAEIEPRAVAVLLRHDWPGNIRELRNALCYALSIADGATVRVDHLPQEVFEADGAAVPETATVIPFPREPVAGTDERGELLEVLRRNRWNISEAARDLGACRATVYRRMKRLDIVSPTQTD